MNNIYDFITLTLVLFLFYIRDSVTDKHHLKLCVLFSCKNGTELPNPSFYCFSSRVLMWSQKQGVMSRIPKPTFFLSTRKLLLLYLLLLLLYFVSNLMAKY